MFDKNSTLEQLQDFLRKNLFALNTVEHDGFWSAALCDEASVVTYGKAATYWGAVNAAVEMYRQVAPVPKQ